MTITPAGWQLDQVALLGAATMFLGAMVAVGIGFVVGRTRGVEAGIGAGMLLWGLGNVAVSLLTVVLVQIDTRVLPLALARCEPSAGSGGEPLRTLYYALPASAGAAAREVGPFPGTGVCPEDRTAPEPLRVREDDLASTRTMIPGDVVDDRAMAIGVTWGLFGGVGLLIGTALLAHQRRARRPARSAPARPVAPLPAWRKSAGDTLGIVGLLSFLAAFVVSPFLSGSEERSIEFGLRCIAAAMGCWLVAGLLARTMTWVAGLFLACFGAVMLLFAALVRHSA